jgi:hypothetical protein
MFFLDYKIITLLLLRRGGIAIAAIAYNSLTPEECRHTLQIVVSICVPGRREPGLNLPLNHVWLGIEVR